MPVLFIFRCRTSTILLSNRRLSSRTFEVQVSSSSEPLPKSSNATHTMHSVQKVICKIRITIMLNEELAVAGLSQSGSSSKCQIYYCQHRWIYVSSSSVPEILMSRLHSPCQQSCLDQLPHTHAHVCTHRHTVSGSAAACQMLFKTVHLFFWFSSKCLSFNSI